MIISHLLASLFNVFPNTLNFLVDTRAEISETRNHQSKQRIIQSRVPQPSRKGLNHYNTKGNKRHHPTLSQPFTSVRITSVLPLVVEHLVSRSHVRLSYLSPIKHASALQERIHGLTGTKHDKELTSEQLPRRGISARKPHAHRRDNSKPQSDKTLSLARPGAALSDLLDDGPHDAQKNRRNKRINLITQHEKLSHSYTKTNLQRNGTKVTASQNQPPPREQDAQSQAPNNRPQKPQQPPE
nr:MAG TPA: hypothetical protein [Caudoviricetes sp.]